jgi:hypothetical protein
VLDQQRDQQLGLAGKVPIDRAGLQADLLGQFAQGHGLEAAGGDQFDRGLADGFFGARAVGSGGAGHGGWGDCRRG